MLAAFSIPLGSVERICRAMHVFLFSLDCVTRLNRRTKHAYHLAYKREFYAHKKPVTRHVEHIAWQKDKGNQKMEAFNGTVRSREKVMRSLKREDSPILDGYQIFHNHVRPHMALGGKTPAELAGIEVKGQNKWMTLIQNASKK